MGRVACIYDPLFLEHDPGPQHPESPSRLRAVIEHLTARGLFERADLRSCPPVTREQLLRIHTADYIDFVMKHRGVGPAVLDDGDTGISADSVDAALLAAGSAIEAVDIVLDGPYDHVFCATRPPGHHALADRAMGFCVFNNIALCAAHALATRDIERVLVVDWDVHHGNGTQDAFYDSDAVFVLNLHQSPFFPRTGTDGETGVGAGYGFTRNHPILARKEDDYYVDLLRKALGELEKNFEPELILVSAGFDAHVADPIGGMRLTEDGFGRMTQLVVETARRHAEGRIISFFEGGYDLRATARSVERHLEVMLGD